MGIPGQDPCYCNSKVLSCLYKNQIATMDGIGGCNRVPFPSDSDDLGLNDIFHSFSHYCSLPRSSCSCILMYKRVSSAKTFCGMSFMYSKNKRGPSTLPCGIPEVTGAGLDVCPSTSTRWLLIHMRKLLLTPYCCSLMASNWWDIYIYICVPHYTYIFCRQSVQEFRRRSGSAAEATNVMPPKQPKSATEASKKFAAEAVTPPKPFVAHIIS